MRVVRKPLLGPTTTSILSVSDAPDDRGLDHNAGKRQRSESSRRSDEDEDGHHTGHGDDENEVHSVKE